MLEQYRKHIEERAAEGVVPKPISAEQMTDLVELIKYPPAGEEEFVLNLLANRVPAGVDEAAYIKVRFPLLQLMSKNTTLTTPGI